MDLTNEGVGSSGLGANIVNKIDHLADYKQYGKVVNVVGMLKVLQFCVDYNVKRFIYSSSSSVYGDV